MQQRGGFFLKVASRLAQADSEKVDKYVQLFHRAVRSNAGLDRFAA